MDGPPPTVPCPLRAAALEVPGDPAVVGAGGTISYRELDGRVAAAERRSRGLGIVPGDRVGLYLPKNVGHLVSMLALVRLGALACPVSTRLPVGVVGPLFDGLGCRGVISTEKNLAGGIETIEPGEILANGPEEGGGVATEMPLGRPATVVFTSGSTGTPKAALHTYGNHHFNALGSNQNIALEPGDRWLHSLPLYHVGGISIIFRCLLARATVALPEPGEELGKSITFLRPTHVSLVSTQLRRLLEGDADLSRTKAVLMGGGPMPASLIDKALSRGVPVHTSYGLTEMASQVATTPPGASRGELGTAGRALPHREVRVAGDGEILVRGKTLFAGYLRDGVPDLPLDPGGWFRTGDLGTLDANGYLSVLGRRDNMFVSGGENIQPEEIEAALLRLDGVREAVVVPVADEEFGERPVAFVRGSAGFGDLARELERVLPRFKIPKSFHDWEGAGGMKPDRVALGRRAARAAP